MIEAVQSAETKPFRWNRNVSDLRFRDSPSSTRQSFRTRHSYRGITLEVDPIEAALFLQEHGLTFDQISKITLRVSAKNSGVPVRESHYAGKYFPESKMIEVSAESAAKVYDGAMDICWGLAKGSIDPNKVRFEGLVTERLPKYLSDRRNYDIDRKLSFAQRLIVKAVERDFNDVFRHEAMHAIDDFQGLWINVGRLTDLSVIHGFPTLVAASLLFVPDRDLLMKIGGAGAMALMLNLGSTMLMGSVAYKLNPAEYRARRFAEKTKDKQKIVTFKINR